MRGCYALVYRKKNPEYEGKTLKKKGDSVLCQRPCNTDGTKALPLLRCHISQFTYFIYTVRALGRKMLSFIQIKDCSQTLFNHKFH